ncbi:MAG: hypothetical protein KAI79_12995 [Bacteroidales bacterium]|nr:hypothetical protein [Bacteroidales bacterium]
MIKEILENEINEGKRFGLSGDRLTYIEAIYNGEDLKLLEFILEGPSSDDKKRLKKLEKQVKENIDTQLKYMSDSDGAPGYERSVASADLKDDQAFRDVVQKALKKI